MSIKIGKLYLIPTTLGDNEPLEVLPISVKKVIEKVDHYIVENEKSARRFIKKISPRKSQSSLHIYVLDKFTDEVESQDYLDACSKGYNIGLVSEAGVPAIADPGALMVQLAHKKGIKVVPMVGPSSITMAMMSSGLNGQNFAFNGYLPIDKAERKKSIKQLEKLSLDKDQSQLFIETPYRNDKMFADLLQTLSANTQLCIAVDITLSTEYIKTQSIQDWKKEKVSLHKRPAIFILHKK
jgi:16S rRNA (cytidine1402-2'-O)-methyltransferase